jgi:phage gp29-like protein
MATLYDQFGNKVQTRALLQEEARPQLTGVRSILSDHPSRGLTPQRITAILSEAEDGDATRYLELAEDMEEKDLHYLAMLGTRKRAVAQLQVTVEAASDDAADVKAADLVREELRRDNLEEVLFDILDAIGKGFSVCELLWETSAKEWRIRDIVFRDPRWFGFGREDGTTLMLREGAQLLPMTPYKYIVHTAKAKSGLPIRGGLARAAAWGFLFKTFSVKDWISFGEVFGQPYRVGKYHPAATAEDKRLLLAAVANIGSDAAAIIPEGMMIEFIEAARTGSVDLYERICTYIDAQVSKAVLGQTLTSDVSSDGGSRALGDVHNDVRGDIQRSDANQLASTLNRCLVRPLVDLNFGPQKSYPRIRIGVSDELPIADLMQHITALVPMGLRVEESVIRDRLGLPDPPKEAVVLQPAAAAPPAPSWHTRSVRTAHAAEEPDAVNEMVAAALEDGWEQVMTPVVSPLQRLVEDVDSLEDLRDRLAELLLEMDTEQLAELLARNLFVAHVAGATGAVDGGA